MKKILFPLLGLTIIAVIGSAIAATVPAKKPVVESYFQLVANGDPMERTDWEPAEAGSCPTTHSNTVCRILAADDSGYPSEASFADILSNSADFSQAYPAKVTYVPEP